MTKGVDYTYPLPPKNLHARYDPVFSAFKAGLNCTLIGYPLSARSGYLKFILEYSKDFLGEFINPNLTDFVIVEGERLSGDELIQQIAAKCVDLPIFSTQKETIENRIKMRDPHLTLIAIQSAIKCFKPEQRLVVIIYETEKILDNNPQAINFLLQLWNTDRNQPTSKVSLCFIASPVLKDKIKQTTWSSIRSAIEEKTIYFPLFDSEETEYLRIRIEKLSGSKINLNIHALAKELSGGHTVLYRLLSQLSFEELNKLEINKIHPSLDGVIETIWNGLSGIEKQNGEFEIPLLPPARKRFEVVNDENIPPLTAQQKLLFDYLHSHPGQVITRDEIAEVVWGNKYLEKYSDWAIDRCISNLKSKLSQTKYQILTLRNRGYLLR